jgi:hypothetical protein
MKLLILLQLIGADLFDHLCARLINTWLSYLFDMQFHESPIGLSVAERTSFH